MITIIYWICEIKIMNASEGFVSNLNALSFIGFGKDPKSLELLCKFRETLKGEHYIKY